MKKGRTKHRREHHGRGGSQHIGRVRVRLAKILSTELGFPVEPEHLHPATGANRTNTALDVYAWELFTRNAAGSRVVAGSFDTMTDCVKAGKVSINQGEISARAT